jgi:hypothetical protein
VNFSSEERLLEETEAKAAMRRSQEQKEAD